MRIRKHLAALIALCLLIGLCPAAVTEDMEYEVASETVELAVPEEERALGGESEADGYADFVGDAAVSAGDEDFVIENGVLTGYTGPGGDVVIPEGVTRISGAFSGNEELTEVTIPRGVKVITDGAFKKCKNLNTAVLPEGLTEIGEEAFYDCNALETVNLPEGLETVGKYAFSYCEALTDITIPRSVRSLGDSAFIGCDALNRVTFESGSALASVGKSCFSSCGFESIDLPQSLTQGMTQFGAFLSGCSSLKRFVIPDGVRTICDNAFTGCNALEEIVIPDSVTEIGESAFQTCFALKEIHIPDGVTTIGDCAFYKCKQLANINMPKGLKYLGSAAFYGCDELDYNFTVPGSVEVLYGDTFNQSSLGSLEIQEGVTAIVAGKYQENTFRFGIRWLTIPASVTEIDWVPIYNVGGTYTGNNSYIGGTTVDHTKDCYFYCVEGSYAEAFAREWGFGRLEVRPAPTVKPTDTPEPTAAPTAAPVSLAKAKVTVKDQTYTGTERRPAVTVKLNGKKLRKGTDYAVSYKNNKVVGTATVTVTGKGGYTGTAKGTFRINPKAVSGLSLTAGSKKLTVSWKKASGVTGYQIQYGLKSSFSGAKKVTVKKAAAVKKVLKNLKAKKTYYVRIRAYKTVKGVNYYSDWSKAVKQRAK